MKMKAQRGVTLWGIACASVLFCLAPADALAVNKCTGPDGKVTYQDVACNGQTATVHAGKSTQQPPKNIMSTSEMAKHFEAQMPAATANAAKAAAARAAYDKQRLNEQSKEPPQLAIGMSRSTVEHLWGAPSRVSSSVTALGTIEIWHYPRGKHSSQSLTLRNDKLSNITSIEH